MSAPASGPFWRAAGMSYVKYANICADMMRSVLKEPFKTKALQRQTIYFRSSKFVDGKQTPAGAFRGGLCSGGGASAVLPGGVEGFRGFGVANAMSSRHTWHAPLTHSPPSYAPSMPNLTVITDLESVPTTSPNKS